MNFHYTVLMQSGWGTLVQIGFSGLNRIKVFVSFVSVFSWGFFSSFYFFIFINFFFMIHSMKKVIIVAKGKYEKSYCIYLSPSLSTCIILGNYHDHTWMGNQNMYKLHLFHIHYNNCCGLIYMTYSVK